MNYLSSVLREVCSTAAAKCRIRQKGNSPRWTLKDPKSIRSGGRTSFSDDSRFVGLEAAIDLRPRNRTPDKGNGTEDVRDL
jgi:hypothetical protein